MRFVRVNIDETEELEDCLDPRAKPELDYFSSRTTQRVGEWKDEELNSVAFGQKALDLIVFDLLMLVNGRINAVLEVPRMPESHGGRC